MIKYTIYGSCTVLAVVIAGTWYSVPVVAVVNEPVAVQNPVVDRTLYIYNSDEFKDEMLKVATARAMFELSIEHHDKAVELSALAVETYANSKILSEEWHQKAQR